MEIRNAKERLIEIILERSFKYSDDPLFTLVSGRKSNYYFNCKPTTLDPEAMNLIGEILFAMLADSEVTAAGGLTLGADPIANALAVISFQKGKPIRSFIVRKDVKDHGTKSGVEGNVRPGERVAILDDVITTGGSTINAGGGAGDRPGDRADRSRGGKRPGEHRGPRRAGGRCFDPDGDHLPLPRKGDRRPPYRQRMMDS